MLDPDEHRTCDVDGAERSGHDSEQHHPCKRPDDFTGEQQQRECSSGGRGVREDGARKCFVDRAVERVVQRFLAALTEIFTHAIEDDDRVVE